MFTCVPASQQRPNTEVRKYINLAVALGERDPTSLDFYSGPQGWVAETRTHPPTLGEIQRRASALAARLRTLSESVGVQEREFEIRQLQAIAVRAAILIGARPKFDQEAQDLFAIRAPHVQDDRASQAVLAEINRLLPGPGSLADRYAAFDAIFLVPADRLTAVLDRALLASRQRTLQHLRLPAGEGVHLEFVSNRPWSAYSRYEGRSQSTIQVNTDLDLTIDRAFRLVCHEAYPGHHVYDTLRDQKLSYTYGHALMKQSQYNALMSIRKVRGKLPVNVIFVAERDEERMDIGLRNFVRDHPDLFKGADIMYGLGFGGSSEGCVYIQLTTSGKSWGRGPVQSDIHGASQAIGRQPGLAAHQDAGVAGFRRRQHAVDSGLEREQAAAHQGATGPAAQTRPRTRT